MCNIIFPKQHISSMESLQIRNQHSTLLADHRQLLVAKHAGDRRASCRWNPLHALPRPRLVDVLSLTLNAHLSRTLRTTFRKNNTCKDEKHATPSRLKISRLSKRNLKMFTYQQTKSTTGWYLHLVYFFACNLASNLQISSRSLQTWPRRRKNKRLR